MRAVPLLITLLVFACEEDAPAAYKPLDCPAGPLPTLRAETPPGPIRDTLPHFEITVDAGALSEMHRDYLADIELPVEVTYDEQVFAGVVMQMHGGAARLAPKKSYRLTFPEEDELPVDFLGPRKQKYRRLVLLASWIDPTWMRNRLTMDLTRAIGGMAPRMGYGTVAINGQWHGLYLLAERIDRQFLARNGVDRNANLYKAFSHAANWKDKPNPLDGYERKLVASESIEPLADLLGAASNTGTSYNAFVRSVESRLHIDDFMYWQVANTFASNGDAFTKNYYLVREVEAPTCSDGGRFQIINWDADASWGNDWRGDPADLGERWHGWDRLSPRLFCVPEYRAAYLALYREALDTTLAPARLSDRIDRMATEMRATAERDLERWGRDPARFDAEVERLRDIAMARRDQLTALLPEE